MQISPFRNKEKTTDQISRDLLTKLLEGAEREKMETFEAECGRDFRETFWNSEPKQRGPVPWVPIAYIQHRYFLDCKSPQIPLDLDRAYDQACRFGECAKKIGFISNETFGSFEGYRLTDKGLLYLQRVYPDKWYIRLAEYLYLRKAATAAWLIALAIALVQWFWKHINWSWLWSH